MSAVLCLLRWLLNQLSASFSTCATVVFRKIIVIAKMSFVSLYYFLKVAIAIWYIIVTCLPLLVGPFSIIYTIPVTCYVGPAFRKVYQIFTWSDDALAQTIFQRWLMGAFQVFQTWTAISWTIISVEVRVSFVYTSDAKNVALLIFNPKVKINAPALKVTNGMTFF